MLRIQAAGTRGLGSARGSGEVGSPYREDVRDRVKAPTRGEGLDVCVENVGGSLFTTLARLMRWNGRLMPNRSKSTQVNIVVIADARGKGIRSGASCFDLVAAPMSSQGITSEL
jgi:NADPH:quinone reductase-like Zn-dependent oxidoreductase